MDAKQFLAEFGYIANAPDGVQHLRELILAFAIQGKLVERRAQEECAQQQLHDMAKTTSHVIGKPVRANKLIESDKPEINTTLPYGWASTSLGNLVRVLNGRAYKKQELLASGTPVLRVGNLFTSNHWYYSNLELEDDKYCDDGDLLYAWSASFGPFIWSGGKAIYHYHIWKLDFFSEAFLNKKYLYTFLLEKTNEIKASGHGIAMAHMTKAEMEKLEVPLPPLEEQSRIVAKVDELMALCDKLEAQQQRKRKLQNKLRQSVLQEVANAESPKELQDSWERLAGNFSYLFAEAEDVKCLREMIYQLAVMGKLTEQHSDASSLLENINSCRKELIKNKQYRLMPKLEKEKLDEFKRINIPAGWIWTRLLDIGEISPRNVIQKEKEMCLADFLPMSGISDSHNGMLFSELRPWLDIKKGYTHFANNDVVVAKITPCFENGKSAVIRNLKSIESIGAGTTELHVFRSIHDGVLPDYVYIFLRSPYFRDEGEKSMTGTAGQKRLPTDFFATYPFPLPPTEEQKQIVIRVNELMQFCDTLEEKLRSAQKTAERLATAAIASLIGISTLQQEEPMKVPKTELKAPVRLGTVQPSSNTQAPLASLLARYNGELGANDLWQRFGGEIDTFYAQLKTEVMHGWIAEPTGAQMLEKEAD
ncbi:MAG: restriction endonuclease subunit S [Thiolinea sp.]